MAADAERAKHRGHQHRVCGDKAVPQTCHNNHGTILHCSRMSTTFSCRTTSPMHLRSRAEKEGAPSNMIHLAANMLMASKWTHRDAAVACRANSWLMPASSGIHCGVSLPPVVQDVAAQARLL